jgi:hypothetical protein
MPASGFARHATTTHSAGNARTARLLCNGASGAKERTAMVREWNRCTTQPT